MEEDFGVADGVAGGDAQGADEAFRDFGAFEALNLAAGFADEVGMLVCGGLVGVAQGVAPHAVLAADAVEDVLAREGVQRAVDGDGIGVRRELLEDLDGTEGAGGLQQDFQHAGADRGAAELGAFEEAGDGIVVRHEEMVRKKRPVSQKGPGHRSIFRCKNEKARNGLSSRAFCQMETRGLEPLTFSMPSRRSPN